MACPDVVVLDLHEAVFCASCQQLTNTKTSSCLFCGSKALVNLAAILDREPDMESENFDA